MAGLDHLNGLSKEMILIEFKKADKDGNGKLSTGEMKSLLLRMTEASGDSETTTEDLDTWLQFIFKMADQDQDQDRMINYEELVKFLSSEPDKATVMKAMFEICDTDGDGRLNKKECAKLMKMNDIEESFVVSMMQSGDADGDGKLNFREYSVLMAALMEDA